MPPSRRYPKKEPVYYKFLDSSHALDRAILDTLVRIGEPGEEKRSDIHNDLGVLLLRFGFERDARDEFNESLHRDRSNYTAWFNLGLLDELAGNSSRAISSFKKCLDLRPGHAMAYFHIGLLEEQKGRRETAVEYYGKAYRFEPRLLDVRYNPLIMQTKLVAETLVATGPRRSLARALPLEVQDGSRINAIMRSRPVVESDEPDEYAPAAKEIGPKDVEPGKGPAIKTTPPPPRTDDRSRRETGLPPGTTPPGND